mgnify:CR=1 FL=1
MEDCIFCKIVSGDMKSQIVDADDSVIVIKDIHPQAPVHYLIIPKKHVRDLSDLDDPVVAADILLMANKLANQLPGDRACKLISNNGRDAGQSVFHFHMHFLSGKKMDAF